MSIGEQSRFVLQPREESVDAFYLLDIANNQTVPVNPPTPFEFDLPSDAAGATIMDGSSPQASVKGVHVTVQGPFAPGHTFVQIASSIPAPDGAIDIAQKLPANLDQLAVIVKKIGETTLKSPQLKEQREMPADGEVFIAATGGPVAAGQPIQIVVDGVPHHSQAPRRIALALAVLIVALGAWFASRPSADAAARAAERARLIARREKLFSELTRLERDHRAGRVDESPLRAAARGAGRRARSDLQRARHLRGGPEPADGRPRRRDGVSVDFDSVQIADVSRHFGRRRALVNFSFTAHSGDIVGLLGPNGAGKSTLITMLATLAAPSKGEIRYGDQPAASSARRCARRIGLLAHELHLYPELSARQNLAFFAELYGLDPRAHVGTALEAPASPIAATRRSARFPAACASGWRSSVRCCMRRGWCCSTSRSPASTIAPSV